jgi:serine protease SohB
MLLHVPKQPSEIRIRHLNARLAQQQQQLAQTVFDKTEQRQLLKRLARENKQRQKDGKRVFVLDFRGDMQASAVDTLREEITLVLSMARAGRDAVVIRLESPGGLVHGYGLAAAQVARLREAGFHVTICVDKVAASGGYMMACIAQQIITAPFAVVGSIGVVAQMPNFHKLLQHLKVDFDVYTAGQYKRTVTMFGENSEDGKAKFEEELQQTHALFKHFVEKYRPQLNVEQVATGEHWYGEDAVKLKLVDQLQTSDAYLLSLLPNHDVYVLQSRHKPTVAEKLGFAASVAIKEVLPVIEGSLQRGFAQLTSKIPAFRDPNL